MQRESEQTIHKIIAGIRKHLTPAWLSQRRVSLGHSGGTIDIARAVASMLRV